MCADSDAVEEQDRVCDQGSTETQFCPPSEDPQRSSTQMEGKRMMITVQPASPVPLEKPRVPVRVRRITIRHQQNVRFFFYNKWKEYQIAFCYFFKIHIHILFTFLPTHTVKIMKLDQSL